MRQKAAETGQNAAAHSADPSGTKEARRADSNLRTQVEQKRLAGQAVSCGPKRNKRGSQGRQKTVDPSGTKETRRAGKELLPRS